MHLSSYLAYNYDIFVSKSVNSCKTTVGHQNDTSELDKCSLSTVYPSLSFEATETDASFDGLSPSSIAKRSSTFVDFVGIVVFQTSPAWPRMKTNTLRIEERRIRHPITMKAALAGNCRKQNPKATAPTFPPAPMIPDIDPVNLGLIYGTILR